MGRQDATTAATVRPPAFRKPDPQNDARMKTREEAPTPPPSKSLLDGYRGAPRRSARSKIRQDGRLLYNTVHHTATHN
jgi:hypothetical protein